MSWLAWLVAGVVLGVTVDRLGLWAERRGWIYWRGRSRGGIGQALSGPLFEAFHPSHRYVIEERERRSLVVQESLQEESHEPGDHR